MDSPTGVPKARVASDQGWCSLQFLQCSYWHVSLMTKEGINH